nr:DUF2530 domain-containing protein [Motilibacter aurantiacus]
MDVDGVGVVTALTGVWALAFLVLLPFKGRLDESGDGWWLWTCLAGVGLGVFGIWFCRRRRDAIRRGTQTRE